MVPDVVGVRAVLISSWQRTFRHASLKLLKYLKVYHSVMIRSLSNTIEGTLTCLQNHAPY